MSGIAEAHCMKNVRANKDIFYNLASSVNRYLRSKNYNLYRKMVESSLFRKIMRSFFGRSFKEVFTPEGYKLIINPIYHGNYLTEQKMVEYESDIRKLMDLIVHKNMVVYDVGANVGIFSVLSLSKIGEGGLVCAFEPEETNFQCLKRTKQINNFQNLEIEAMCVGEKSGIQWFDRRGGAFSGRLTDHVAPDAGNLVPVSVVSLDDYVFKPGGRAPDLVKIDVEGNELKVVKGMERLLIQRRPMIVLELHASLDPRVLEIYHLLSAQNYDCYEVKDWVENKREPLRSFERASHVFAFRR